MRIIDLCGLWDAECRFADDNKFEYKASVPGCAIGDLIAAKRLPEDIFWRDNADAVAEFESCDYVYKKEFDFDGEYRRAILRFERIDTYADLFLNGKSIYHSENGNIRHDIDVTDFLEVGKNLLEIRLYSASEWVKGRPLRRGAFTKERMYTRRMQCTYGWDWVARFLTCGLGDCSLLIPGELEISGEDIYIATLDADSESASVRVDVSFPDKYEGRVLEFSILDPDGKTACRILKYCAESLVRLDLDIPEPRFWYPLGYGAQPLYTFILKDGDRLLASERFGIRTVKIMQLPDKVGSKNHGLCLSVKNSEYDLNESFSGFVLKVNGEKIFCRGANWVPCVPFACGNIDARQTEILERCAEAGVNMLRIWGGGAFESKHFYNECSRLGIMVTQDFLMACGAYPEEEEWFIEELRREALYAARLCRNQPCLMWWSGDNENAVKGCDTDADYRGRRSAYNGIAPVIYREDPHRRFLPSSPYGGRLYASNTVGTTHNTQFLGQLFPYLLGEDMSDYKEELKKYRARFIAEEPQLGAISLPSLRRFMTDDDIFERDEIWSYHTKNNPSLDFTLFDCLCNVAKRILGDFKDGKDRLFKLQYVQYEWLRVVMEQARREREFCSGIIFWMMNDCWPASTGWSLIDYYTLPKNAYYAFKRTAKQTIVSLDREGDIYRAYVINDGAARELKVCVRVLSEDRTALRDIARQRVTVPSASSVCVYEGCGLLGESEALVCEIEGEGVRDRAFYIRGGLEIERAEAELSIDREKRELRVSAGEKYIHAAVVSGNIIPSDNCFSLLPHESRTVSYKPLCEGSDTEMITLEAYTLHTNTRQP